MDDRNNDPKLNGGPGGLAIIAGNGGLPLDIAEAFTARGDRVVVFGISGEADPKIEHYEHEWCEWERAGHLFKSIEAHGLKDLVLAGGVIGRPEFKLHKLDWGAIRTLSGLLAAMLGGDNHILSGVINAIEKRGFTVRNIAELLPELTVRAGANTGLKPKAANRKRIEHGFEVAQTMGQFDIGQACVIVGSRAVALEGVEGTDAMLRRVADLREIGRLPKKRGGVLVKVVKPGQDERADLPAIGPGTVEAVHAAGLEGIGVHAGKTLMIEKQKTLTMARENDVFIFGHEPKDQTG
ncbi:MAG: UDP-2,3-diacylglucosamine diphosphatase LpxI [Rhizobiaceae bacterium]|nr:UDP-2,3-diacylglucosamine diphosphatase LpxI [Hyphomicrobiales bacterium]NRB29687.1 UDP-2,3-diacylglucosamine diphosphatase LpxI [Rhizobiaceae bacterium]